MVCVVMATGGARGGVARGALRAWRLRQGQGKWQRPLSTAGGPPPGEGEEREEPATTGRGGGAMDVSEVLRSTQSAHHLLQSFYLGQRRGQRGRAAGASEAVDMAAVEDTRMRWYGEDMPRHRVRPSCLLPLVQAAGFAGGLVATMLPESGKAMVTRAVEETFAEHINDQLRELHACASAAPPSAPVNHLKSKLIDTRDAARETDESAAAEEGGGSTGPSASETTGDFFKDMQQQLLSAENLLETSIRMGYKGIVAQTKKL